MSPFDPRLCTTPEAAEAYRRYQLTRPYFHDTRPAQAAPFGFPYRHRTCAEWMNAISHREEGDTF